jgi:hypothetical protein
MPLKLLLWRYYQLAQQGLAFVFQVLGDDKGESKADQRLLDLNPSL